MLLLLKAQLLYFNLQDNKYEKAYELKSSNGTITNARKKSPILELLCFVNREQDSHSYNQVRGASNRVFKLSLFSITPQVAN